MKVENPAALRFIMPDELYLLNADKALYINKAQPMPVAEAVAAPAAEPVAKPMAEPVVMPGPVSFDYLGQNKKAFLIIVNYPGLEFIHDVHLTALQNILNRLAFEMDDVAILNRAKYEGASFEELINFFNPRKLLLLGIDALPAGIAGLTLNQPKQLQNCNALFSFSFDEMMDSNENKKAFWEQMKQL
ncbi:hypothetical protein BH09BAC6_BH09BAC6_28790 [soil metagenome]|jgi:hypothetical protein